MGRLVKLWKAEESENSVAYLYGPDPAHAGRLLIEKNTGVVSGESAVPGMSAEDGWFFYGMLAKAKAEKMFKMQEYPDEATQAA